jgi:hypothetical protein
LLVLVNYPASFPMVMVHKFSGYPNSKDILISNVK